MLLWLLIWLLLWLLFLFLFWLFNIVILFVNLVFMLLIILISNILNLKHKSFNGEWRKHSFSVRTPKLWNEIADSVRSSKTLNSFHC